MVMTLKTSLNVTEGIVMILEPFIGNQEICNSGFNFYWLQKEKKEIRVITAIQKDFADKIIVEYITDFINHPYFMSLKICKLDAQSKNLGRKTRVINMYHNQVGIRFTGDGCICHIKKALEDINWKPIIRVRVLKAGKIKAHSSIWNFHCNK